MLADTAEHWRFDVEEAVAEGDGVLAFGVLAGRFLDDGTPTAAELHRPGRIAFLGQVVLHYPPEDGHPDACLRLLGVHPDGLAPPAALFPARCAARVHTPVVVL
ncbi:hypothetical protein ACF1D2_33290 [Streptomyces bacillaris]|uniref:hypothetical protein n=1 Tax=Streptomyces bacillaris TaxID=68179 RepID=UPI0036F7F4FF